MSTSFATSPDSGHSGPCTPPRGQAHLVHSFAYNDHFLLGTFRHKSEFRNFLDVHPPEGDRGEHYCTCLRCWLSCRHIVFTLDFPNRPTLVFRNTEHISPNDHVTDTMCRPDITAALEDDWNNNNGVVPWPFIRLAGKKASAGKSEDDQKRQAMSYLHYLLLARPDLYVVQGLLSSSDKVKFLFGIGGEGIREFDVEWNDPDLNNLLYAFIYRLYEPGERFADPSYTGTKPDKETTATYTIKITYQGGTKDCPGFYPVYARNPFTTRTHVLSNPNFKVEGNDLTVLKDQFCRVEGRFEELRILNEYVHKPERVPGVVVAAYGETIRHPMFKERCKYRLGLGESGSPFASIPTLSKVLETLFDVLEVLRYLRLHRKVLHRDISSGNVLYVENSSKRSLPPNAVSVSPAQEAEINGLPLCYAKYLLGLSSNPLETSMLLVDFNLAEHLDPDKKTQIARTGTPLFIARAVERGGPVPPVFARVPGIPNSPGRYADAHPDRVKNFSSSNKEFIFNPKETGDNEFHGMWRHELEHDAESVFWLLIYWAVVAQPENTPKEKIDTESWAALNGDHGSRTRLISNLPRHMSPNLLHSFYDLLRPLIKDLAAILVIDSHWLPASDLRSDRYYITEAFQRLILDFMIKNRGKPFMEHCVDKTFRKPRSIDWGL
ncbi:hypothetical protein BGW80DRAFT_1357311 [Lactifluus volemus]|nr:hypothetical protein BGW80DRAFT_1357311 [Lactifluus volemus]